MYPSIRFIDAVWPWWWWWRCGVACGYFLVRAFSTLNGFGNEIKQTNTMYEVMLFRCWLWISITTNELLLLGVFAKPEIANWLLQKNHLNGVKYCIVEMLLGFPTLCRNESLLADNISFILFLFITNAGSIRVQTY